MRLTDALYLFVIILGILLITSCATQPIAKVIVPLDSPVPQVPEKVILPLSTLTSNSSPSSVIKAYIATTRLLIIDNTDLRARLNAYKHAP